MSLKISSKKNLDYVTFESWVKMVNQIDHLMDIIDRQNGILAGITLRLSKLDGTKITAKNRRILVSLMAKGYKK